MDTVKNVWAFIGTFFGREAQTNPCSGPPLPLFSWLSHYLVSSMMGFGCCLFLSLNWHFRVRSVAMAAIAFMRMLAVLTVQIIVSDHPATVVASLFVLCSMVWRIAATQHHLHAKARSLS